MAQHKALSATQRPSRARKVWKWLGLSFMAFWATVGLLFVAVPLTVVGVQHLSAPKSNVVDGLQVCIDLDNGDTYTQIAMERAAAEGITYTEAVTTVMADINNHCSSKLP